MGHGSPLAGPQVVEEYNRREVEIQNLEEELGDLSEALTTYRMNMSEVQRKPEMVGLRYFEATRMRCFILGYWIAVQVVVLRFVGH